MARMPGVPFQPPRSYSTGRPEGPPRFVVIHYTAGSEGPTAAEDGVRYDQTRNDGTSTHFFVDRDSIIQCVDTTNRAHTALYHGNLWGIHIEQCGTAQTRAQWLDAASRATIRNAAKVAAWAMRVHNIPLQRLVGSQVRTGRGICGHVDCTTGWPEDGGTHTDPGPQYPWDVLLDDIRTELTGDDMTASWGETVASGALGSMTRDEWLKGGRAAAAEVKNARADIAGVGTQVAGMRATIEALAAAVTAGGGDVDVATILARVDEQAEQTRVAVAALQADLDEMQTENAELRRKLAEALAS